MLNHGNFGKRRTISCQLTKWMRATSAVDLYLLYAA